MMSYKVPEFYNTHPGEILLDELKARGLSAAELARHIGLAPSRISQILHAKRAVTADTALRLGILFGTSPKFWLNLQQSYDLYQTAKFHQKEISKVIQPLMTRSLSLLQ